MEILKRKELLKIILANKKPTEAPVLPTSEKPSLKPESIQTKKYEILGEEIPIIFHAGPKKIKKIDPKKLGKRDSGWYGEGFYGSFSSSYARLWYGPVVTAFHPDPKASVLVAAVTAAQAPKGLFKEILENEKQFLKARKAEDKLKDIKKQLMDNQIEWVHAVDRYAEKEKYDIVIFTDHEIVIKNFKKVKALGQVD